MPIVWQAKRLKHSELSSRTGVFDNKYEVKIETQKIHAYITWIRLKK